MLLAERLRHATAETHQGLDRTLDLLRDDLTLDGYVGVLRALYGFVAPWEARVTATGWVDADELVLRRHAPRLLADLDHFGTAPGDVALAEQLPTLGSRAALLGSRYVMEGSTLGGRVVSPHLARRFGLDAEHGGAWFGGYGDRTGALWRAFRRQLEALPESAHDDAVAGAVDTFDLLARWVRHALRAPAAA
jgi:heme oxygenase